MNDIWYTVFNSGGMADWVICKWIIFQILLAKHLDCEKILILLPRLCMLADTKTTTLHYCHMICPFIEVFRAAYLIWHSVPTLANFYQCLRRLGERVRSREEIFTNVTWMFVSVVLVQMGALVSVLVLLLFA